LPPQGARNRPLVFFALLVVCCFSIVAVPQTNKPADVPLTKQQFDFFEGKVRPIFVNNCYKCHSPANGAPRNGLELDWKGGWQQGGNEGPAVDSG
jgi:cytochrome c5